MLPTNEMLREFVEACHARDMAARAIHLNRELGPEAEDNNGPALHAAWNVENVRFLNVRMACYAILNQK